MRVKTPFIIENQSALVANSSESLSQSFTFCLIYSNIVGSLTLRPYSAGNKENAC